MPLTIEEILSFSGPAAFARGEGYAAEGRVVLTVVGDHGFRAKAQGSQRYSLYCQLEGDESVWYCSCPAAADGSFCKHLVAGALLTWHSEEPPDVPGLRPDPLLESLRAQPRERLADWLYEAAMADEELEARLRISVMPLDQREMKRIISDLLRSGGFLDYYRSLDYSSRIEPVVDVLHDTLARDAEECLTLADHTLSRLIRIYERSDDSSGTIGDVVERIAMIHRSAAAATAPHGAGFARRLLKLKERESWNLLPLEPYWTLLDARGQASYRRALTKTFEGLSARLPSRSRVDAGEFGVTHRLEELARLEGDFETLKAVALRGLGEAYGYRAIVELCHEFDRPAEAASWAEEGLRDFPDHPTTRKVAVGEFLRAGLREEAVELLWREFEDRPTEFVWGELKAAANPETWATLRLQGLGRLAQAEHTLPDGRVNASLRIRCLQAEGELEAARDLALKQAAAPHVLEDLAAELAGDDPGTAAGLLRRALDQALQGANASTYARIVPDLRRILDLDPGPETRAWLASVRERYRRRPKLIGLMDDAGL